MDGTICLGLRMISQYRLFTNTNSFYPYDSRTFGLRGKVPIKNHFFDDMQIPVKRYIYDALYDFMESLGYDHEQNDQYDAIELDVEESGLEW